jgi:hypothetical protein
MVLREYMARMDGQDPEKALELLEPGFRFLIALPDGHRTGTSRDQFAGYIAGRNAVHRRHEIVRYSVDGDVGAFLSAVQVSPAGLMARYQSFFTPDFDLVDRP